MKFHKHPHRRKIKRYRKVKVKEYAILFDDSNRLIDYICSLKSTDIINSSLYTSHGCYQLLISTDKPQSLLKIKNIIFYDRLHIDEIKTRCRLICKTDTISKFQKAFKAP